MNILVTGSNGQLGRSLKDRVESVERKDKFFFTDIEDLDICNRKDVKRFVENNKIGMIINCAAYTNVERAESDLQKAEEINAEAVGILAESLLPENGFLLHISTDYVFGGSEGNTPRNESQAAHPTGVYGETKLHGEQMIKRSGVQHIIIRTAWLYSEYGNNFFKTMHKLTAEKPELKVVFDQIGTPTYAGDLADCILKIVETPNLRENTGIYHFSNEGVCSWYDFAQMIARIAGHTQCDIKPCHSDEFPSAVKRPSYSVLDKTKIKNTFNIEIPFWVDSIKTCNANYEG